MSSKKTAIVGAGAIGLYLAWKLSRSGHRVTVFEKNSQVGQKPCSGLISERIKNFIPWENSLAESKIDSCLTHFPQKTVNLKFKPVHFAICRQKLDQFLYHLAREAGAEILLNRQIKEIPYGFDKIIGCDGAFSVIRKSLGLSNPVFRLGIQGFSVSENSSPILAENGSPQSSRVEVWPTGSGFFWKIPRGKKTEYGLIGDPRTAQQEFKEQLLRFGQSDLRDVGAAMVPQGLILPKGKPGRSISAGFSFIKPRIAKQAEIPLPGKDVTLCGDALGLCKPWSGGGIIWGLTAADILLKHFPDFEKYHREVKRFFWFKILKSRMMNSLVYFLGNNFPRVLPSKLTRDNDFPTL